MHGPHNYATLLSVTLGPSFKLEDLLCELPYGSQVFFAAANASVSLLLPYVAWLRLHLNRHVLTPPSYTEGEKTLGKSCDWTRGLWSTT